MLYFKPTVLNTSYFNIEKRCVSPRTNFFLFRLETKQSKLVSNRISSKTVADKVNNLVSFNSRFASFSYYINESLGSEIITNGALINFANDWIKTGNPGQIVGGGAFINQFQGIGQSNPTAKENTQYTVTFDITFVSDTPELYINLYGGIHLITPAVQSYSLNLSSGVGNNTVNFSNTSAAPSSFLIKNISVKETVFHPEQTFINIKTNSEMVLKIYEQTSSTNVDPESSTVLGLRWQGLAVLPGTSEVEYQQHADPSTQNYVYFKD